MIALHCTFPTLPPRGSSRVRNATEAPDGILESESPHGEEFGSQRLLEVLRQHRERSAREIVDRIYDAVQEFTEHEKQADDVTIVICKRDPDAG